MQKPIRVLQVFTIMNRGGAESMIMNYYRHINRSKVQFDFLVHRKERGTFDDEIERLGGGIYRLGHIPFHNIKAYKNVLDDFFQLHKYQIVHSHLNAMSKYVLQSAKKNNIPFRIAHSHTVLPKLSFKNIIKNKLSIIDILKIIYKNQAKKNIYNYITHAFACEEKAGKWLFGQRLINEIKIINNAINANRFVYNNEVKKKIKNELKLNDKIVFGHIGNFTFPKNYHKLIDIFHEIHKQNPESILLLIGDGTLKPAIVKKVKKLNLQDSVRFMGIQKDIPYFMQAMDAFIMPSLYEGLPVTLIEAQAAGLKCFVSDTVDNNVDITGLVDFIPLDDSPKIWAEYILNNINYERKNTFNQIVTKKYDIKQNALELQNFYLDLKNER